MRRPKPLLCRIGWHKPIAPGLWNAGYCFTSCSRCGRDMVRSVFGEWHVPTQFRVVWSVPERADPLRSPEPPSAVSTHPPAATPPVADVIAARSPFDFDDFD